MGALGQFVLGAWLIGTSWVVRTETRAFAFVGVGAGSGAVGYAIRTGVAGQPPLPVTGRLDLAILAGIGLIPVWVTWLAARLAGGAAAP